MIELFDDCGWESSDIQTGSKSKKKAVMVR
jgi:hypothetical protein